MLELFSTLARLLVFSTLSLSLLDGKAALGRKFSCTCFQQSLAMASNVVQAIRIKRVMLQFRGVLSVCRVECWCGLTIGMLTSGTCSSRVFIGVCVRGRGVGVCGHSRNVWYLGLTLVLVWDGALREGFSFCFSRVSC